MENQITVFSSNMFEDIRTITDNNIVYFCANDVAKNLGYKRPNDAVSAHCRATVKYSTLISGKMQMINYITESDVYRLIAHSKLPKAVEFEKWIFEDILPSIRKHGGYLTPQKVEEALLNPDVLIELATQLKVEREKNQELEVQNELMKPKASYYDIVLQSDSLLPITVIAKDYGWSAVKLNNFLCFNKIQYKCDGTYVLYQKYADKGYVGTKTNTYTDKDNEVQTKVHTYWTQKGRLFIYELMKKNGTLPLIEQNETEN